MKTIKLIQGKQNGENVIIVSFYANETLENHLMQLKELKRDNSSGKFYIKSTGQNLSLVFNHMRKIKCYVDYTELKQKQTDKPKKKEKLYLPPIDSLNKQNLDRFRKWLEEKRLSPNTVDTYVEVTNFFLRYTILKNSRSHSRRLVESFNYEFIVREGKSISYQNQCINGIKKYFLFKGIDIGALNLSRPKKEKKLPVVLNKAEVRSIIDATHNLKHKTLLSLIYSGGLRIGEAINLRIDDIDSGRMLMHIKGGKGKKDRYTLLSASFLKILREYYKQFRPKEYLFEGQKAVKYSASSAQSVLKKAVMSSGIRKKVTLHTLRHSFATHLLESGTDIRYIQELLGHNDPKTTMIYTHVTENSIKNINNPFDDL